MTKADMMAEMAYTKAPVGVEDHGVASPGEDPKPPHTPALRWLADRDGVATQEWQDGFNTAYSYYAQQYTAVEGLACRIENYHWDIADKPVAERFAAELRTLAQQSTPRPPRGRGDTSCGFGPSRTAKQPAAVDGAMPVLVELVATLAATGTVTGGRIYFPERQTRGLLKRACDALAAQPGGSDNDR